MSLLKKFAAVSTTAALVALGVVGAAVSASAHTPSVSATCEALTVNLTNYQPGSPATTKVIHHDAIPETTHVVAGAHHDAVMGTDFQRYSFVKAKNDHTDPTTTPPSDEWQADEKKKPGDDPIGSAFQKNDSGNGNWFFWTGTPVEITAAYDDPSTTVGNGDGVAAYDETVPDKAAVTNEVSVIIDGATVVDHQSFGSSYVQSFPVGDKTVTHSYKVIVRAYDDPDGSQGWSKNFTGTTTPCLPPPPPTYEPTCTQVTGPNHIITGDGVLTVEGDWDSTTVSVPFSGSTLADIGTLLDIQAAPIQYVGLHIHTAKGTIVFEEEPSYGENLWSNVAWDGVAGGMGYPAFGSITEFIHLNGNVAVTGIDLLYTSPVASSTTVTWFTIGCTIYTFEPSDVVTGTPLPPTFVDVCGTDNDEVNIPDDTEEYTYDSWIDEDGTTVHVTVWANDGFVLPEGAQTEWSFTFTDEPCPVDEPKVIVPTNPTVTDACGPDNVVVTLPADTAEITYSQETKDGVITVTATAANGFVFEDDSEYYDTWVWEISDTNVACPTTTPPATPPVAPAVNTVTPPLAFTGIELWQGAAAVALLLVLGISTVVGTRRRPATI